MEEAAPSDDDEGGGGAPGWMATFADLMSLLLAFFVLLFSFSSIDDQLYKEMYKTVGQADLHIVSHTDLYRFNL